MPPQARLLTALATALVALIAATPAHAGKVIVVDGKTAVVKHDPLVPAARDVKLVPPSGRGTATSAGRVRLTASGARAVSKALGKALKGKGVSRASYNRYKRDYAKARRVWRKLRGARADQLGYVIATINRIALRRRLIASRLRGLFVELERNTRYWPSLPYPASGDQIAFKGSELLYQYYPGRGLQLQVLSTFKKANNMHAACFGTLDAPCRRAGLKKLLDEMISMAVRRSRKFIAWEYMFDFGGGAPPWISGMAEATGIQALGRAAQLLDEPSYDDVARKAMGAFETRPPLGIRTRGFRGGVHYLQYSFAPRLYIFNAFMQSLIGLYDFSKLTGDARALKLYNAAKPEADREIPYSDLGDWTLYNYRGHEANHDYHELLREFMASMCSRRLGAIYCTLAKKYAGYQVDPPVLVYTGPDTARRNRYMRVRFNVSKLSAVEIYVYKGRKLALHRIATFRRGNGSFLFKPRSTGTFTVRLGAKELRTGLGKKDKSTGEFEVVAP
jgi:hypothetical protein